MNKCCYCNAIIRGYYKNMCMGCEAISIAIDAVVKSACGLPYNKQCKSYWQNKVKEVITHKYEDFRDVEKNPEKFYS